MTTKRDFLRITDAELPSRCLELRRQADQLWVTLLGKAEASFEERALVPGERTAWPKSAALTLGGVRLVVADPTARVLEQLEHGRTERLADDAVIDPPSGGDDSGDEDEDETPADQGEGEDWAEDDAAGAEAAGAAGTGADGTALATAVPQRAATAQRRWSRADAVVFFLAIGVLALSL